MTLKRTLRVVLTLTLASAGSSAVMAQDGGGDPATAPYYIPGMPVPQPEGDKASSSKDSAKGDSGKRGRIAKITRSNRDADTQPVEDAVTKLTVNELYRGIIPGVRDWHLLPRRLRDAAAKNPKRHRNRMTWLGFSQSEKGSTVWFQTIKQAAYSVRDAEDGNVVVTLLGTKIPRSNERRAVDTSYWPSAVSRVDAGRSGGNAVIVISLHESASYAVRQEGEFLYVDFNDLGTQPFQDKQKQQDQKAEAAEKAEAAKSKASQDASARPTTGGGGGSSSAGGTDDSLQPIE